MNQNDQHHYFTSFSASLLPLCSFIFIWGGVFFLYFTSPFKYNQISPRGWIYICGSLLSFIIGYILHGVLVIDKISIYRNLSENDIKPIIYIFQEKIKYTIFVLSLLVIIGSVWKLKILGGYVGGIIEYLKNPIRARYYVTLSSGNIVQGYSIYDTFASYLINFNIVNNLLGGLFFVISRKRSLIGWIPLVLATVVSIITFQRWLLLFSICIWVVSGLYIPLYLTTDENCRAYKKIKIAILFLSIVFAVFVVMLLTLRMDLKTEVVGQISISVSDIIKKNLHSYLVGNVVNFDNFIHRFHDYHYGTSILRNIFKWFARIGIYNADAVIPTGYEFSNVGFISLNTYSYMRIFYEDFGTIGLMILSALWGLFSHWIIMIYKARFSLYRLFFVCLIFHAIVMSFFSFSLLNIIVIGFSLFTILVINKLTGQIVIYARS
ncbi:MAG: O-antigen ligase [Candidatus Marinimicrobia bacterium]|nr:O-antigen ligase [Candidatus Neomarinimicrobiota bacterium]